MNLGPESSGQQVAWIQYLMSADAQSELSDEAARAMWVLFRLQAQYQDGFGSGEEE